MALKIKVIMEDGREIGPLPLEKVGELFLRKHIRGDEECIVFPQNQRTTLTNIDEVRELIKYLVVNDVTLDQFLADDSQTMVHINIKRKEIEEYSGALDEDDETRSFQEFTYNKTSGLGPIEVDVSEEMEATRTHQNSLQTVREIREAKLNKEDVDATVFKPLKETAPAKPEEEFPPKPKAVIEEEKKKKEEEEKKKPTFEADAATEMFEFNKHLPQVRAEAKVAEKEIQRKIEEIEEEESEYEDEEKSGKKGMSVITMLAFFGVIFYLLYGEEEQTEKKKVFEPSYIKIVFPISAAVEDSNVEKSKIAYNQAVDLYNQGTYAAKILSAEKFRESLFYKFEDNPALGQLILIYSELYYDASDKAKAGQTIFRLTQIARSKVYKDLYVAMGTALFYAKAEKYETAKNILEGYLRVTQKPSIKLFSYLLDILIEVNDEEGADKVYETLSAKEQRPLETYIAFINYAFYKNDMEMAEKWVEEGLRTFGGSVAMYLSYCKLLVRNKDYTKLDSVLIQIKERAAEGSPLFYSKYLQYMGILAALQQKEKQAVLFFRQALKLYESEELRSLLSALEVGGASYVEKLILESRAIDLINQSREARTNNNWDLAIEYAVEAADQAPFHPPAQLYLAKIQSERGFLEESIQTLEKLHEQIPLNKTVNYILLQAYVNAYKFAIAQQHIVKLSSTKFINTFEYNAALGYFYEKKGSLEQSFRSYKKALDLRPLSDEINYSLGRLYLRERKYKYAKKYLNRAIQLDPGNVTYKIEYSKIIQELSGVKPAIGYLREILEERPDDPQILGEIAAHYSRGNLIKQFEDYKKRVEKLSDRDGNFYRFLINVAEDDEQKLEAVRELAKVEPGDLQNRILLGEMYLERDEIALAEKTFKGILERLTSYPRLHYFLALTALKQKKFDQAIELGEKEIKHNPTLEFGYYIVGEAKKALEEYQEAVKYLERALTINSKSIPTLMALADIKRKQRYFELAREMYLRVIREDNNIPIAHRNLGYVFADSGQGRLAIQSFKMYLQLLPNANDRKLIEQLMRTLQ